MLDETLRRRVRDIARDSTRPLDAEADVPFLHFKHGLNTTYDLTRYLAKHARLSGGARPEALEAHLCRLRALVAVGLVEAFERLLKEMLAACIDVLAPLATDDRFGKPTLSPGIMIAHFETGSVGRAVAESQMFSDSRKIREVFGQLLRDPDKTNAWEVFPVELRDPATPPDLDELKRAELLDVVMQLRHSIVHNLGVLTKSDALKLGLMTKTVLKAPRKFWLEQTDVLSLKLFLYETAKLLNDRISDRLFDLETALATKAKRPCPGAARQRLPLSS